MKMEGSLINRLQENQMFCDEIKVGTQLTEYQYVDRLPYEVIEVHDQKHIVIRRMKMIAKPNSKPMSNEWICVSCPDYAPIDLVKRGKYWYIEKTFEAVNLRDDDQMQRLHLVMNGYDINVIKEKGYQKKYERMNVSFGKADPYFDYSF